jgi:hypothetical protein
MRFSIYRKEEAGMKNKKIVYFSLAILILFSLSSFAETKKLEQIGRYTLVRIKGEVPTEEVMKTLVEKYAPDIKYGFDLAGYGDLFLPFMDQIKESAFKEKEIAIGDKFKWMLFRSRGKVKVVEDLEWAGKEPLPVFSFTVVKGFMHYEIVMPKPCGNISLLKVEEIIPDAVCDIQVEPEKANINDPISVDMSGSKHAKSMEVEVFNAEGKKIATKSLTADSPKWQTKFDKPGEYVFKAKAFNAKGAPSTNPCDAKTYINHPPTCQLAATPTEDFITRPFTFDASGSADSDGEVVKADFEIADETGNVVDTHSTDKPFNWEMVFDEPGVYTVTVVVTDDFGAMSEPCRAEINVKEKKLYVLADVGLLQAKGSHGPYVDGRLGIAVMLPSNFSLFVEGGGALAMKDEPWKSFMLLNATLNYHFDPVYVGAGVGFNTQVREDRDQTDLFLLGHIGVNIFNNYTSIGSIFFEGQGPIGENRSFGKHHKLILGFRLLF